MPNVRGVEIRPDPKVFRPLPNRLTPNGVMDARLQLGTDSDHTTARSKIHNGSIIADIIKPHITINTNSSLRTFNILSFLPTKGLNLKAIVTFYTFFLKLIYEFALYPELLC